MAKLTEAQKRANKKWNDAHKKRMNYILGEDQILKISFLNMQMKKI